MKHIWLPLMALLLLATACGGPTPVPTVQPRLPEVPISLETVQRIELLSTDANPRGTVYALDFSDDGQYFLGLSGGDNAVHVWDAQAMQILWSLTNINASGAFFAVDDTQVAMLKYDGHVRIYRTEDRAELRDFRGHSELVSAAAMSPDGRLLALGGEDGSVNIWNLADELRALALDAHQEPILGVFFSPDSASLATIGNDRAMRMWDLDTGEIRFAQEDLTQLIYTVIFSPDGEQIAINSDLGVKIYSAADGTFIREISTTPLAASREVVFVPGGEVLAGGRTDALSIWNATTGEQVATLPGHGDHFEDLALNPTGDLLVTIAFPGQAYLWNMENLIQRRELSSAEDEITVAGWTMDSRVLVLGTAEGTIQFWGIVEESAAP